MPLSRPSEFMIKSDCKFDSTTPITGQEPTDLPAGTYGPAVEFPDGATKGVMFNQRGEKGHALKLEVTLASTVASAGSFFAQVGYSVDGAVEVLQTFAVTPGANTNLYVADLGLVVPASALTSLKPYINWTFRRLGAHASDTNTGAMDVYVLVAKEV